MKSLLLASLLGVMTAGTVMADWVEVAPNQETGIRLLSDSPGMTRIECGVAGFESNPIAIDGKLYQQLELPGEPTLLVAGAPKLPVMASSFILPDRGQPSLRIIEAEYIDLPMMVAPSKGNLTRDIDPATVPFTFGKAYDDGIFPEESARLNDPYIMRDYRGVALTFQPFQYLPAERTLRVCTHMVVEVETSGVGGSNIIERAAAPTSIDAAFDEVYNRRFMNYDGDRYTSLDEHGHMLIICDDQFLDEMEPFVEWKMQSGMSVEMVAKSDVGTSATAIQNYVEDYYIVPGLTFLLLIGDSAEMPSLSASGGSSDPGYSFLEGGDYYPDIFVGRFSGSTSDHINTLVERCVEYERDPQMGAEWYHRGFGVASSEGAGNGDDGEADYQHMDNIRADLLGYNYDVVDQLYANNGASAASVSASLNSGRSVGDYCGHGSETTWVTTGFSNNHINALTNDNMLPFIFDVACVNGQFAGITCFAEAWMRATHNGEPTGAIGIYASTINQSWAPPMAGQDEMIDLLVAEEKMTFGGLCFNGAMLMNDEYQDYPQTETWTIFTDPSLLVRTNTPAALAISHSPTMLSTLSTLTVQTGQETATAALYADGVLFGTGSAMAGGQIDISMDVAPSVGDVLTLTVSGFNLGTYQGTVEVIPPDGPYVSFDSVSLDGDGQLNASESVVLDLGISNDGVDPANDLTLTLSTPHAGISLTDDGETYGSLAAGGTVVLPMSFAFDADNSLSDGEVVPFILTVEDGSAHTWVSNFNLIATAPLLSLATYVVNDGDNGRLDPGETADLILTVQNDGGAAVTGLLGALTGGDAYVDVTVGTDNLAAIASGASGQFTFEVQASAETPVGHAVNFAFNIEADNGSLTEALALTIGLTIEDFETADFSSFDWTGGGDANWVIDSDAHTGMYSGKSGPIGDGNTTDLVLDINVMAAGDLSFFYKVSSEATYDFFRFFIDGSSMMTADGEVSWTEASFPLSVGNHVLTWQYDKDYSVSSGSDCAWVDDIIFPAIQPPAFPDVNVDPVAVEMTAPVGSSVQSDLLISNTGGASLDWTLSFNETTPAFATETKALSMSQDRSMEGSYMALGQSSFESGASYVLDVSLYNGSADNEWATDGSLQFPAGVTVTAATNLTGGTAGDLEYDGSLGDGALVSWFDADAGYGNVYPAETAVATVSITIAADFNGDMLIPWSITGDQWGEDPHTVSGDLTLTNDGDVDPEWLTMDISGGQLASGASETVVLTADALLLSEGTYTGVLTLHSNDPNEPLIELPLTFIVGDFDLDPVQDLAIHYAGNCNSMLSWTPVPGAEFYRIYHADEVEGPWTAFTESQDPYWMISCGVFEQKFYRVTCVAGE
jgi:hypothetical protein